jgi:hypothetical protein
VWHKLQLRAGVQQLLECSASLASLHACNHNTYLSVANIGTFDVMLKVCPPLLCLC